MQCRLMHDTGCFTASLAESPHCAAGTSCSSAVGLYSFDSLVMADNALWQCTGQAFAVVDHAMCHGSALAVPVVAHNAMQSKEALTSVSQEAI